MATPSGQALDAGGAAPGRAARDDDWPEPVRPGSGGSAAGAARTGEAAPAQGHPGHPQAAPAAQAGASGGSATAALQQQWPAVLAALKQRSIVVWANVSTNAQVVGVEGNLVTLGFTQIGAMKNFTGGGKDAVVATALSDVLGGTWRVEAVVGNGPPPSRGIGPSGGAPVHQSGPQGGGPGPQAAGPQGGGFHGTAPQGTGPQGGGSGAQDARAGGGAGPSAEAGPVADTSAGAPAGETAAARTAQRPTTDESWPTAPDDPGPEPPTGGMAGAGLAAARSAARAAAQAGPRVPAARPGSSGGTGGWPSVIPGRGTPDADEVDPLNDADADVDELSGMALLQRELGAQVIGEIDHT